jgi:tetratricopeptide (TPR) repeat protein
MDALEIKESSSETRSLQLAETVYNLALVTEEDATRAALYERAQSLMVNRLGPAHPKSLEISTRRIYSMRDPAAAHARTSVNCELLARHYAVDISRRFLCLGLRAHLEHELGEVTREQSTYAEMLTLIDNDPSEVPPELKPAFDAQRAHALASGQLLRGQLDMAIETLASHPLAALPWWAQEFVIEGHVLLGEALAAAGRHEQAIASLQATVDILSASPDAQSYEAVIGRQLARARVSLASALLDLDEVSLKTDKMTEGASPRSRALTALGAAAAWTRGGAPVNRRRAAAIEQLQARAGLTK